MELTGKQRASLRSLCNTLQPVLYIGKEGVTDATVKEAYDALEARELIKCSLNDTAPLSAREACTLLCERLGAQPVQCIGRKFAIYRQNEKEPKIFIHPIIRGIIIHFMIAYMHPFVEGNGRTARALFYWYMLKQKYWLMEYLSISRVIAKSKKSYEKSFLYTEADNNDIGYFVAYNLRVLDLSFKQLQGYLKRKQEEKKAANTFLQLGDINDRQAQIIKMFVDNPKEVITVKDIQSKFFVSATTAKGDIMGLVDRGLINEFAFINTRQCEFALSCRRKDVYSCIFTMFISFNKDQRMIYIFSFITPNDEEKHHSLFSVQMKLRCQNILLKEYRTDGFSLD